MRIKRISVQKYKNLVDFECIFSDSSISAFIGNNGSGKSNLLEVITEVFSFAKKHCEDTRYNIIVPPEIYGCEIEYEKDGVCYILKYSKAAVTLYCDEKELSRSEMNAALPESILIYYAGETARQKRTAVETLDVRYDNRLKSSNNNTFPGYKFIDYYSLDDLGLLLLTAAVYQGEYYSKLLDLLKCKEVLPEINIMLKNPKGKKQENADTYWGARGFVPSFLDALRRYVSSTQNLLSYYSMRFSDISLFKSVSSCESEFFTKLKAIKNAGYLDWVVLSLCSNSGETFSFDMLSEGEKQLSLLFLLTTFTAQDNCLYIFDEFDAYLHLNWQRQISKMLNDINMNGHLLFTTHSPATISNIRSDELYVMKDGQVLYPETETFNRALDEIMLEQMGITMRAPHVEALYDAFKQSIADQDKDKANAIMAELKEILDPNDPIFIKMRLVLRRI